jgi:hypothetical protein
MKANKTMRGQGISNHRIRKTRNRGITLISAAYSQTLKQQKTTK